MTEKENTAKYSMIKMYDDVRLGNLGHTFLLFGYKDYSLCFGVSLNENQY